MFKKMKLALERLVLPKKIAEKFSGGSMDENNNNNKNKKSVSLIIQLFSQKLKNVFLLIFTLMPILKNIYRVRKFPFLKKSVSLYF